MSVRTGQDMPESHLDAASRSPIARVDLYSYDLTYVGGEYLMSGDRVISSLASTVVRVETEDGFVGFNRVGGLTQARLLRDVGQALGLIVNIEDSWGGDLTTAAVSHLAASTPAETTWMISFMNDWTREHIAGHRPRSHGGIGTAPAGPGLGIDVDMASIARFDSFGHRDA